jgi:hypothetical protein
MVCKLENEWIVNAWLAGKNYWLMRAKPVFMRRLTLFKGATVKSVSECNLYERRIKPGMNLM